MKAHTIYFFFKKKANIINKLILLLLVLISFTSSTIGAEESLDTARRLSKSGQILPLEKIVASAIAIKPGDFLEIELERKKNVYLYEVEILDHQGQVWELKFNAKTGQLIELERDD